MNGIRFSCDLVGRVVDALDRICAGSRSLHSPPPIELRGVEAGVRLTPGPGPLMGQPEPCGAGAKRGRH